MVRRILVVGVLLLLAVTGGCTSGASLAGTWKATAASPQVLVPGVDVTLTFADGRVMGKAGCNAFGGDYTVSNGRLTIPQLGTTLMYCGGAVGDQENWIMQLLGASPTISVAGDTMVLSDGTNSMTLRRA